MSEFPKILYDGECYYQIGCKSCQNAYDFTFFSNGKDFLLHCSCGNKVIIKKDNLRKEPEGVK